MNKEEIVLLLILFNDLLCVNVCIYYMNINVLDFLHFNRIYKTYKYHKTHHNYNYFAVDQKEILLLE